MKFLLPILLLSLIASCSTYQYVTVNSDQMKKNENRELVWENDTLKITYNFHGMNGPMKINVYNKTDQPLYINWKKSAFIHGQESTSLYNS